MSIDYRAEFDIPRDICYLNAAYMAPQPRRVVEAAIRGATRRSQPWQITPADFFSEVEDVAGCFRATGRMFCRQYRDRAVGQLWRGLCGGEFAGKAGRRHIGAA